MCPCLFMLHGFAWAEQMYLLPHAGLLGTPWSPPGQGSAGGAHSSGGPANIVQGCPKVPAQLRGGTRRCVAWLGSEAGTSAWLVPSGSTDPFPALEGLRTRGRKDAAHVQP